LLSNQNQHANNLCLFANMSLRRMNLLYVSIHWSSIQAQYAMPALLERHQRRWRLVVISTAIAKPVSTCSCRDRKPLISHPKLALSIPGVALVCCEALGASGTFGRHGRCPSTRPLPSKLGRVACSVKLRRARSHSRSSSWMTSCCFASRLCAEMA